MMPLLRRLGWLFQRKQKESDLEEELRFHLEEEAAARRDDGASEAAARRAARIDLGSPAVIAEDTRAAWGWTLWEQFAQDVRYAFRTMKRSRVFVTVAIVSLALGIGVNTILYSFTDAILVRTLPVSDPASLVRMTWHASEQEVHGSSYHDSAYGDGTAGYTDGVFSYPALLAFAEAGVFANAFAYQSTGPISVSIHNQAEPSVGEYVSAGYFSTLGLAPAAGRLLGAADDQVGAAFAAVVDFGFANSRFGGAAAAVGQTLSINQTRFTVVGVAPRGFFGTDPGAAPAVYVPMHSNAVLDADNPYSAPLARYTDAGEFWVEVMARLKPGVSLTQAQAALAPRFHQMGERLHAAGAWHQVPELLLVPGARGIDGLRRGYSSPLLLLQGLAGLMLALACANIANLLLARATARTREIGIRLSLGAGRVRVVRQLMTESLVLSVLGGALGVLIAIAGQRVATTLLANGQSDFTLHAALNWGVLLFACGLSLVTGLAFGLAPALQSTRKDLRSRGAGSRRALIVAQIAATLVLLVAAGLLLRTIANLESIGVGFDRDHVLTVTLDARQAGLKNDAAISFYRDLRTRFAGLPGVAAVGLSDLALVGDGRSGTMISAHGGEPRGSRVLKAGGGFFAAMQIPLVLGRAFDERDDAPDARPVAIVNQSFARANFGAANPLGQALGIPHGSPKVSGLPFEIVGVARDVRYGRITAASEPLVYFPFSSSMWGDIGQMVFEIRTTAAPASYVRAIRDIVRDANPGVPISRVATQAELIDRTIGRQMLLARLCAVFALLALTIAVVGLYGTVAYDVARRTAEIGIRIALGAGRGRVLVMVLGDVLMLVVTGVAIGIPAALGASRFTRSFLFGLTSNDPLTLVVSVCVLLGSALAASYLPARAASRLDPTTALRHE
jgi:predicted permease